MCAIMFVEVRVESKQKVIVMDTVEHPEEPAERITELAGGELWFKDEFNTPEELLATGAHNSPHQSAGGWNRKRNTLKRRHGQ